MFSKQESSQLKKEFWTSFGQYMKPVPSTEGEKINWINYKTGNKNVIFKMDADSNSATVAIQIVHANADTQQLYYERFLQVKKLLNKVLNEEWMWIASANDENGRMMSKIYRELRSVSIFQKTDWPEIISFLKTTIIALDEFWNVVKYRFEDLP